MHLPAICGMGVLQLSDMCCAFQAAAEPNGMISGGPSAVAVFPPETDAQLLQPSASAAKGRGKARKAAKQMPSSLASSKSWLLIQVSRLVISSCSPIITVLQLLHILELQIDLLFLLLPMYLSRLCGSPSQFATISCSLSLCC